MNATSRKSGWSPSPDFVRAVLKGHSSLGLAFAAAIYLVCLTGALVVFVSEFQRWENPSAPRLESVSPQAVQTAYVAALAKAGEGIEHVWITLPRADLPWLLVTTDRAGEQQSWIADAEGRLVAPARDGWSHFLTELHVSLHLPRTWGVFIVGLTGVALLSSLISGILAHPRIFRDAFHLRLGGSRRLQEADLHNRIGVWALPFHVIVSLTGALLGLTTLIVGVLGMALFQGDTQKVYDLFLPPHPMEDERPAPPLDLRPMFATVSARAPDGRIEYVFLEHPTETGGAAMFNVRSAPDRLAGLDSYTFDRKASLYHQSIAAQSNLGVKILGSLGPLHFGWFGGGAIKIAYGILGLGLAYLAAGGVIIWLARRRDKGRPAPLWERLWTATVWGQPLALAAAALSAMLLPATGHAVPLATWGGVSIAAFIASAFVLPAALAQIGKVATGALLILLVAIQLMQAPGRIDPMAWAVNAALLLAGVLLVYPVAARLKSAGRTG